MPRTIHATRPPQHATRDVILDAAERHFADAGYAAASVRAIAHEAGLKNQASLYHYFRDKRELYEAVMQRGVDAIAFFVRQGERMLDQPGTAGTVAARAAAVDATVDRVVDYLIGHRHLAKLMQRAALDDGGYLREALAAIFRPLFLRGIRALVGHESGIWTEAELPHLAAALYHMIFGYFASSGLLEAVMLEDPFDEHALQRQRRFLKTALGQLLGLGSRRVAARIVQEAKEST